ncbi:hypothetical protein [Armatimonas sp.]|uniref:hypothetical protein n=1 Tax=Armatimonas sp. TaxID=1872638 RepID=UPI003751BD56
MTLFFTGLAWCFQGFGLPTLLVLTFVGLGLVAYNRRNPPQTSPPERLKQHY